MEKALARTIKHGVEVLAVAAVVVTAMIVFRDPVTALIVKVAHNPAVADAVISVVTALLTVLGSTLAKGYRTKYRDYVND